MPTQPINPQVLYPRDIRIKVNDDKNIRDAGMLVAPYRLGTYKLKFRTYGSIPNFDVVVIETCHRHVKLEKQGDTFYYDYTPTHLERTEYCPMHIKGYDLKGRHSWGFIDFANIIRPMAASLQCNGERTENAVGSMVCQNKIGLMTQLITEDKSIVFPSEGCEIESVKSEQVYEWKIKPGFCVYLFQSKTTRRQVRLTTFGYEEILVRQ